MGLITTGHQFDPLSFIAIRIKEIHVFFKCRCWAKAGLGIAVPLGPFFRKNLLNFWWQRKKFQMIFTFFQLVCDQLSLFFGTGKYDVHVKWNGRHIPKSPFRVEVGQDLDASQAYASGPGLQPEGIQAGKYTDFTVYTKGAGEGQVSVKVIDPRGGEDVDIIIEPQEDSQYFVEYQPVNAGKHTIKVMFGGQPISKSPFHVMVSPPRVEPIPSKVRVFGTGKKAALCAHSLLESVESN